MSLSGWDLLTPTQREVAQQVVGQEQAKRNHLVVALSGAHAYGFPSPDSDLDLKSVHIAPTSELLGLRPQCPSYDRCEVIRSVEIDYTSNEIGPVLVSVLRGNGNYIERLLGAFGLSVSPLLFDLQPVLRKAICRRVHDHYRGFAHQQRRELDRKPTVKKLLYVLRTTLTGTHLLRTGQVVTQLGELVDDDGFGWARELIQQKQRGENTSLEAGQLQGWNAEIDRAFQVLSDSKTSSVLPVEPTNEAVAGLNDWLVSVRRSMLQIS